MGLIPELGRLPGEGNGSPLQCSCLGNPMDRGAWRATVPGVAKCCLVYIVFDSVTPWSMPGSSVHGISQARKMEWVAISFSRGSS